MTPQYIYNKSQGEGDQHELHTRPAGNTRLNERLLIADKANTSKPCDCDTQDTPGDIKAAFAVHCVFDLAQTETKGEQIWVPGQAIPGSGSGDAGVG